MIWTGVSIIGTQPFMHDGGVNGPEWKLSVHGSAIGNYATIDPRSINWGLQHRGKPCRRIPRCTKSRSATVRRTMQDVSSVHVLGCCSLARPGL